MNSLAALLLMLTLPPAEDKPTPKLPLGKDTTYITEPLDKDGYLDYEAALNDRFGKGVTPEKNANVLFWKALGPRPEGGKSMPAGYFKRLGIEEPPVEGDYFVGIDSPDMKEKFKLDKDGIKDARDQLDRTMERPWKAKEYPMIAHWLTLNEKPLALVLEATKRPSYFNPLVSERTQNGPSGMIAALMPTAQKCRALASALAVRAMLRTGEGRIDEAWQDLLTCHRLGRLISHGSTLIEALVGIAINQVACNADLVYLEHASLTSKQIQNQLKDLQALKPLAPYVEKIDISERYFFLDSTQHLRRHGLAYLEGISATKPAPKKPDAEAEKAMGKIDWAPALRNANQWYDRMAQALRNQDREARDKELEKIEADLKAKRKEAMDSSLFVRLLNVADPKKVGPAIGDTLIRLLLPAVRKVQNAYDRSEQVQQNLYLAFALAAYHADMKKYPAKLDDVTPKYIAALPKDLFSGKALIYRLTEKGYPLYSVGINGKDEEGRTYGDDPAGDDIVVRMPLPEPSKK